MRTTLLLSILLIITPLRAQERGGVISGAIRGMVNDTLYISLEAYDSSGKPVYQTLISDTLVTSGGKFSYSLNNEYFTIVKIIPAGGLARITRGGMLIAYDSDIIELFVDKGDVIEIEANFDGKVIQYTLKGSSLNETFSNFRNCLFEHQRERIDALREIALLREAKQPLAPGQATLKSAMDQIKAKTLEFIEENLNNPITPKLIYINFFNDHELILAYKERLGREALESPLALSYIRHLSYVEGIKEKKIEIVNEEELFNSIKGTVAPDFTLKTINGESFTLSSLKGKYVILDFWGSWCGWCIEAIPQLLEFAKMNKDKVVVVAIACNDTDERWRAAVAKYKMNHFINVLDKEKKVSKLYKVRAFPTYLLISPQGTIEPVKDYEIFKRFDKI